jgi:hypothetical protein
MVRDRDEADTENREASVGWVVVDLKGYSRLAFYTVSRPEYVVLCSLKTRQPNRHDVEARTHVKLAGTYTN